jgi:hypothetical protein
MEKDYVAYPFITYKTPLPKKVDYYGLKSDTTICSAYWTRLFLGQKDVTFGA